MKEYLKIMKLVWPLAFGMINNALMQFVDRAFLARESMISLEAVLPASMLSLVLLCFFQAIVAYSGTFVANYHGAKDLRFTMLSYRAGLLLAVLFGVLSLGLLPLGGMIFEAVSHSAEVIARQKVYFEICTAGGIFLYIQMASQSYFTGRGKTRTVLIINILGNVVNIVLDYILIFGCGFIPRLGIAGAAIATVASLATQCIALLVMAKLSERMSAVKIRPSDWFSKDMLLLLARIIRFGVPSGAYNVLNLLSFTIFVFFTGRVGHLYAAVSNACFAVNYLLFAPIEGFALGASTLVAQAKGANDIAAAHRAGWRTAWLAVGVTVVLMAITLLAYRPILMIFAPDNPALAEQFVEQGWILLLLMTAWQIFEVFDTVVSGALKGAGDTTFVLWWMLLNAFVLWIPAVIAVSFIDNTMPTLWATMIGYVAILSIGTTIRWQRGKWKAISIDK